MRPFPLPCLLLDEEISITEASHAPIAKRLKALDGAKQESKQKQSNSKEKK